jgi:hypothetical protein
MTFSITTLSIGIKTHHLMPLSIMFYAIDTRITSQLSNDIVPLEPGANVMDVFTAVSYVFLQ